MICLALSQMAEIEIVQGDITELVWPFIFLVLMPGGVYWDIGRTFSKLPPYFKLAHWRIFDDRIEIATRLYDERMSWDIFVRIVETHWGFLFLLNNQSLLIFPKRCLSSAADLVAIRNQVQIHAKRAG